MGVRKLLKFGPFGSSLASLKRDVAPIKHHKMVSGSLILLAIILVLVENTSGENQPNLTTVETLSETQIRVTWEPMTGDDIKYPIRYELCIDDHLEYFGNDLMYVARRLTPDTMYNFKLRLCRQDTNKCTNYSKTLSGVTTHSRKRSFFKSFFQWLLLLSLVVACALLSVFTGHRISRKLWRSFLYKYDYRSETNIGPKYLVNAEILDEEILSVFVKTPTNREKNELKNRESSNSTLKNSDLEDQDQINERNLGTEESCEYEEYLDVEAGVPEYLKNNEECRDEGVLGGEGNSDYVISNKKSKSEHMYISEMDSRNYDISTSECNSKKSTILGKPVIKSSKNMEKTSISKSTYRSELLENEDVESVDKYSKPNSDNLISISKRLRNVRDDIVVVIDNSNIYIGAQECANALNPRERRRHVRVKIQNLTKVLERGRMLIQGYVQGSSPPTNEQVWEVYRRLGYCVDLEDRRGKDEQRVDEGLHLNIYKAICEQSPKKLVIASGDGNKGKSEGATSLPGCAQAALDKGWQVEVHSWQHSLSTEWLKLTRRYPKNFTICFLDRYVNYITFVDGKNGRKAQPISTDLFTKSEKQDVSHTNVHRT